MKDVLVWALGVLAAFLVTIVIVFAATGSDFFMYKWFAPRQEAVRREVFEQSKAYNQGMIQELQNMQFQYVQATPEQKAALSSVILHRVADYDLDRLPPDTRAFVMQLKNERTSK